MFFSRDIGIDLGTANTLVYMRGKGIVMREPSVVAVDVKKEEVMAVGSEAKEMIGRTPGSISAVRPLKDGVIADFEVTSAMLRHFIKAALHSTLFNRPRLIVCIPSGVTEVERRAVDEAARQAGAKDVELIAEPMAAAIGAGLQVEEAAGCMVVDIGEAIISYIKKKYNLLIGERTAEDIKIRLGSAFPYDEEESMDVKGRNLVDGLPKNITVTSEEIRESLADPVSAIVDAIRSTLERTPPELSADIINNGIMLTGGGALLRGLDVLINRETGMPVHVAEDPLDCVVMGTGKCLDLGMVSNFRSNRSK